MKVQLAVITLILTFVVNAATVDVVILQTSDIHGQLTPTENSSDVLRLATALRNERKRAGNGNVLYIDCGDTLQGSAIAAFSRGEAALNALEVLQPDAWILGNHDLDFGVQRIKQLIKSTSLTVVNGNLTLENFPPLKSFMMYERHGARIVVIGMNTPYLRHWLWGKAYDGFRVEPALDVLKRMMPKIHSLKPHMIILAAHQGFLPGKRRLPDELRAIADRFPQIDLIIGGHTHQAIPATLVGRTYYVQPGKHASHLAKVVATIDVDRHRIVRLRSELIETCGLQPDPIAAKKLAPWLKKAKEVGLRKVVETPVDISSKGCPGKDNHMSEVLCRAIAWKTKAPVVFHGTLSKWAWRKGVIDEDSLFAAVPYTNGIGAASLSKDEVIQIINEQLKHLGKYDMNGLYGLHADVNWKTKHVKNLEWPAGTERLRVAFNSYVIAGAGARFPVLRGIVRGKDAKLTEETTSSRDAVRQYLKSVPDWSRPPERWLR